MDWQPIETAPVEAWVLGYFPNDGNPSNGDWRWAQVWTVYQARPGDWYGDHHSSEYGNEKPRAPTHWMPLPEPPC